MKELPTYKNFLSVLSFLLATLFLMLSFAACEPREEAPEFPVNPNKPSIDDPTTNKAIDSGDMADGALEWEFCNDGTLYIRGTGDIPEYDNQSFEISDLPWNPYRRFTADTPITIQKIVIEEGVTSISATAFSSCRDLVSVSLPTSLTAIEFGAFTDCRKLKTVTGGIGITRIGENAFQGCTDLRTLSFSTVLQTVEYSAFVGCTDLSIRVTGSVEEWTAARATMTVAEGNEAFLAAAEAAQCFPR